MSLSTNICRVLSGTCCVLVIALIPTASIAQLTFVPDVDLRAAINMEVPGAVDANGYIDGANPVVLATQSMDIEFTWHPVDLTGIEAFTALESLGLSSVTALYSFAAPAWPPNITVLTLDIGGLVCLPLLPNTLIYLYWDVPPVLSCFPNLPPAMQVYMFGIPLYVDSTLICNLINTTCPLLRPALAGRVYVDGNGNGLYEPGEQPYTLAHASLAPTGAVAGIAPDGMYSVGVDVGSHIITCIPHSVYIDSITPAFHDAQFTDPFQVDTLNDFAVHLQPNVQDLVIDLTNVTPARPGFTSDQHITYFNAGTQVQNGAVSFTYDPLMSFVSSSVPPDVVNGNTLTWNFTQLQISEYRVINVVLQLPPGVAIGTAISHTMVADPVATDQAPGDNTHTYADVVVGSYDPNDKAVQPSQRTPAEVAAGESVDYTIRFQNTGTYMAERVVITDTLSSDLQWNTMQLVSASHLHSWYISNGVLHVIFDDIMLPDSTSDEPGSHGFVKFRMQPMSTLTLGESVANIANIYFDFNEPVITNAAVFSVNNNVGVVEAEVNGMRIYPNPATDELILVVNTASANATVEVVDVTGRVVFRSFTSVQATRVDVSSLKPGCYHVRVATMGTAPFIKQ